MERGEAAGEGGKEHTLRVVVLSGRLMYLMNCTAGSELTTYFLLLPDCGCYVTSHFLSMADCIRALEARINLLPFKLPLSGTLSQKPIQ